jgi:Tfp pilus assembly protein PilO
MIWREKRTLLIALGLLLAANAFYFLTYGVQYQSRLDTLEDRLSAAEQRLELARAERRKAERNLEGYRQVERDVNVIFDDYWSTEEARLTAMIAEVKRLAVASSMVPASITFDKVVSAAPNARRDTRIGATEVGMSFMVQGTYEQVRRLVNLMELSQQFVIIDRITLGSADVNVLTLNLHVKTLFRDDDEPARPGQRRS